MLEPAILYKEELLKKFSREIYSDRYWWYTGWGICHELPDLEPRDGDFRWAIVNDSSEVIGYLAYRIDLATNSVDNFGLYSFLSDKSIVQRARILGKDVFSKMEELILTYHRVSWRVIEGNPVKRSYDNIASKFAVKEAFQVTVAELHDITKDPQGNYHGEFIYEIINKERI